MTKPTATRAFVTIVTAAAAALALLTPDADASQRTGSRAAEPTPGAMLAVDAITSDDVWAVGYQQPAPGTATPLAEHGDGGSWRRTKTPTPEGQPYGTLQAVTAVSSDDVWAVGYASAVSGGASTTLAEHWNGRKWKIVPTQEPAGSTWSALQSVTALSTDDVWAVGYFYGGDGGSVIEHWDGTSWSLVTSADPAGAYDANLTSVDALSATNIWAVGTYFDTSGAAVTLAEHWDGRTWSLVDSPNPEGAPDAEFHAVSVRSKNDVWATGFTTITGSLFLTLVEHWDGTQWTIVDSPNPEGSADSYLYGAEALTARNAWATGYYIAGGNLHTFAEHWNGRKWKVIDTPDFGGSSYLFGIDALSRDDIS
jgi:hypothetical protein